MKIKQMGAAALASVLLALCFGGCTARLQTGDVETAFKKAVENTMKADIYYWKENRINGKETDYRQVNVFVPQDSHYEPILNEQGEYEQVQVEVVESHNSKNLIRRVCALSGGANKNDEQKAYLFLTDYEDGKESNHTKTPMTGKEYFKSDAFRPYTLAAVLEELTELTVDDMDFSIKDSVKQKKANVTNLTFGIKEEYLKRYEAKHAKPSLYAGTKKVSIELAYDRVANVITYTDEQLDKGVSLEIEKYKIEIVYLGPKIGVPTYNAKDAKGEDVWKDA